MGLFSSIAKLAGPVVGAVTGQPWLGAAIGGAASYLGQSSANDANRDLAEQQMAFQQANSNTSYQRARADLEKAGFNPIIAALNGGASTPAGASAKMEDAVTPSLHTALAVRRQHQELQNMQTQNFVNESQGVLNDTMAAKAATETQAIAAELPKREFRNRAYDIGNKLLEPIEQSIKGHSARSLMSPSGVLPPPVFSGKAVNTPGKPTTYKLQ